MNENIDDTPAGSLFEGLIEVIDEFYSANLAQDTKRGMRESVSRGHFCGSNPPMGYKAETIGIGASVKRILVLDEDYAPTIRLIFDLALSGKGAKEIVNELNRKGIRTNRGKSWGKGVVQYMLRNEAYTGTLLWGKFDPNMEPIRREENHPAIVTKDEFRRVQNSIQQRDPHNCRPRTLSSDYLLSGMIFCGKCGHALQGCAGKSSRYHYYACHNSLRKGKTECDAAMVNRERIESALIQRLQDQVLTDENLSKLLDLTNREIQELNSSTDQQTQSLEREIERRQRKLDNLYAALETGKVDVDDIAPRIKELRTQIAQYRDQQLSSSLNAGQTIKPLTTRQLKAYVADLRALLVEGSIFERKGFIKSFVRKIIVKDKQVTVTYTYPMVGKVGELGNTEVLCSGQKSSPGWA